MKKSELLNMLATAWGDEDAHYYVGDGTDERDFHDGLAPYRAYFISKTELQCMIDQEPADTFCMMPERLDYLVLNKSRFISLTSIKKQQVYPTSVSTEGMTHVCEEGMPHYDVYFSVDHDSKEITFALGDRKETFKLIEHSKWVWKASIKRKRLYTTTSEMLERNFSTPFWSSHCINVGRAMLGFELSEL